MYSCSLLNHDVEERSRVLTGHGLRRVLDGLRPSSAGPAGGLPAADRKAASSRSAGAHARSPSMAAGRRDRRGTVAADANELCPTPVSVSALLINGLSF